jgi:hypothetical protein
MTNPTSKKSDSWMSYLICLFLILGSNPHWMTDTARVVVARAECVLSPPDAWRVALAESTFVERIADWPFSVYAIVAAALISLICRRWAIAVAPFTLFAAMGLSLLVQPAHLLCILFLFLVAMVRSSHRLADRPVSAMMLINVIGFMSVVCLLEFGLVLFFCGYVLILIVYEHRTAQRPSWLVYAPIVLAVVGLVAASFSMPNFANAMVQ